MIFINSENFGKIGLKITIIAEKNGVFYVFLDPVERAPTLQKIWNQFLENGSIGLKIAKNAPWDI